MAKALSKSQIAGALADVAGNGGEKCTTYADCLALLNAGTEIDFGGVTGPLDFNQYGDPANATIQINQYTSNGAF
ncbi:MAG: amino acid ABC transporter substrate-binding protein, partial [Verrucomicrobia bacterium]|nr:amino acid ABC transporter substrate-binding protein [Verrucomicrobiota bacterium]